MLKISADTSLLNGETVVLIKYLWDCDLFDESSIYILRLIEDIEEHCCVCLKGGSEI